MYTQSRQNFDKIWEIVRRSYGTMQKKFRHNLDSRKNFNKILTKFKQNFNKILIKFRQNFNKIQTKFKPNLDKIQTKFKQNLDKI